VSISRAPVVGGFPDELDVKLNYTYFTSLSTSSTLASNYVFRLNDIYDPDYTGTGGQPMYRDQLFALYGTSVTWACDYDVKVGSASANPVYLTTTVQRNVRTTADFREVTERGESMRPEIVTTAHPITLKRHVDIARSLGVSRATLLSDDLYSQSSSGSPTNILALAIAACDATSSSTIVYINIKLTFYVRFRKLVEITTS